MTVPHWAACQIAVYEASGGSKPDHGFHMEKLFYKAHDSWAHPQKKSN